jgi:hypothetical protein
MVKNHTNKLIALQRQKAELLATVETVRLTIQAIISVLPPEPWSAKQFQESPDEADRFMNQVLAELGVQFTTVDIFEQAKKLKPGLERAELKRAVNRLQWTGMIQKIEAGRGRHPARYQKRIPH